MNQRTLFDCDSAPIGHHGYPIARASDKETSKIAAAKIEPKLGHLSQTFVNCLVALGQSSTAREVAEHARRIGLCKEVESVRKRAGELVNCGRIVADGERECNETGNVATVYKVVK